MAEIRAEIYISGGVQMVGFRSFTARHATTLGLKGYVRNLPDGRVHVIVEGKEGRVEELVALLQAGPAGAYVQDVHVHRSAPTGEFTNFCIRYVY
jgi:acylphosphatase